MPAKRQQSRSDSVPSKRASRKSTTSHKSQQFKHEDSLTSFKRVWTMICKEEGLSPIPETEKFENTSAYDRSDFDFKKLFAESNMNKDRLESRDVVVCVERDKPLGGNVTSVQIKGDFLNVPLASAISRTVKRFSSIACLNLSGCSLNVDELYVIRDLVMDAPHLKDLKMDYCPLAEQIHYILIVPGSSLESLSLKCCKLNDKGIKQLSRHLVTNTTLRFLNLGYNGIKCSGAKNLAKALKWNRSLVSLSLSGNKIKDKGARAISDAFQIFYLKKDEIRQRRKRIMNYLYQRQTAIFETCDNDIIDMEDTISTLSVDSDHQEKSSTVNPIFTRDPVEEFVINKDILAYVNFTIPSDTHPLVSEVIDTECGPICQGNYSLLHLNLSYNQIAEVGISSFLAAVTYQDVYEIKGFAKGLSVICLQGNKLNETHPFLLTLQEILYQSSAVYEVLRQNAPRSSLSLRSSQASHKSKLSGISATRQSVKM